MVWRVRLLYGVTNNKRKWLWSKNHLKRVTGFQWLWALCVSMSWCLDPLLNLLALQLCWYPPKIMDSKGFVMLPFVFVPASGVWSNPAGSRHVTTWSTPQLFANSFVFAPFFFALRFQHGDLCRCCLQQHHLAAIPGPKGPLVVAGQGEL